ncbi:MAG: hypothetical protein A4S09_02365 [Proteobacteria bacterium SG_bin7]|nr:MAG: hypothetical protein A4S09_02365 [Proteobacteria bacterium SG_bin7]
MPKKPLVFIPTYNERENAQLLFKEINALGLDIDVLFMDDNSPDGTGKFLEEMTKFYPNLKVVHRSGKLGVGSAHFDGIRWAYEHGYTDLVTMDCDFTHPPKYIPDILNEGKEADVTVGSRYMTEGSLAEWNMLRKFLTRTGHFLTKFLLGMDYDATGGFRYYRLDRIPQHVFQMVRSKGYSFFFESLYVIFRNGFKIKEIPIALPKRTYGHSKMAFSEVKRSVRLLFTLYFTQILNPERFRLAAPLKPSEIDPTLNDTQGWDDYWKDHKKASGILYDSVAAFYRKFIIKRTLNYFTTNYFPPKAQVLHAGCGGGQVDTDVADYANVTGLDISVNALNFFKRTHMGKSQVLHGSIFNIRMSDGTFDGVYNLGVMEHFTENEINGILKEFHRILKPGGRAIIFWPPEFGLSVIFFKCLKWIFVNILGKKNVKFHPDEITRVQSRQHVTRLFENNGFRVIRYYFGLMDLFTYSIIVAEKVDFDSKAANNVIGPRISPPNLVL